MSAAVNLRHHSCTINLHRRGTFSGTRFPRRILHLRHQPRCFSSLSIRPENVSPEPPVSSSSPSPSAFVSSLGSSPSPVHLSQRNFTQRHILALNVIACAVAISATWLFCSAIPTLLAFKRAAESLEKLLDVTREELPDTMAAIRLSGMEISDLTMELSDLGQEITQGVRSSTRAVRGAEEKLRRLTNMTPSVLLQEVPHPKPIAPAAAPALARSARAIREGVMKGRTIWNIFFTFTRYSRWVFKYFSTQAK